MELAPASPYQIVEHNALQSYQFPILAGTTHAIFTRQGGVSPSPWASLNMGSTVGDDLENVSANFRLACDALQIGPNRTVACLQVHGSDALVAAPGEATQFLGDADAMVAREAGVYLTMRFADCVPILLYDPVVGAVGAAHAGWRGTMKNVMGSVIKAMQHHFGSRAADIRVVIGPSIGPCCYRVGDDVFEAARNTFGNPTPFFVHRENGLYFNIWQANLRQAYNAGATRIVNSEICTACHTREFFSHRAEKGKTGRFAAFIGLPEVGGKD